MTELGLADTNGILSLPWIDPVRTSAGLGWERLYVSTQAELPYRSSFCSARTHQLILHLDGPVKAVARVCHSRSRVSRAAACAARPWRLRVPSASCAARLLTS